jgi:hypothetical protein
MIFEIYFRIQEFWKKPTGAYTIKHFTASLLFAIISWFLNTSVGQGSCREILD